MRHRTMLAALALSTLSVQALAQQSRREEEAANAKPKRPTKADKKAAKRARRNAGVDVGARGWPADKGAEPVPLPKLPPAIVMHPKLGELFDRLQMQTYAMGYAVACANAGVTAAPVQTFPHEPPMKDSP